MTRWRIPFRLIVPVLLMAIVAVLAALQYRWLGQVSEAERARMRETITARAEALAHDLDHEVARVFVAFQLRQPELPALEDALERRYRLWRDSTRYPDLVRALYIARGDGTLESFDIATKTLRRIDWPDALAPLRVEQRHEPPAPGTASFSVRFPRAISTDPLAVSILLPFESRSGQAPLHALTFPGVVLAVLDAPTMKNTIVPALAREHLGDSLDEYRALIVDAASPSDVVYGSADDAREVDAARADVAIDALTLRASLAERVLATDLRAATAFAAGLEASGRIRDVPGVRGPDHLTLLIQQPAQTGASEPHAPRMTTMAKSTRRAIRFAST